MQPDRKVFAHPRLTKPGVDATNGCNNNYWRLPAYLGCYVSFDRCWELSYRDYAKAVLVLVFFQCAVGDGCCRSMFAIIDFDLRFLQFARRLYARGKYLYKYCECCSGQRHCMAGTAVVRRKVLHIRIVLSPLPSLQRYRYKYLYSTGTRSTRCTRLRSTVLRTCTSKTPEPEPHSRVEMPSYHVSLIAEHEWETSRVKRLCFDMR
jgi:hypothetical protein